MRQRIFTSVIVCTIATIALAKADPIATSAGTVTGVLLPDGAVRAYKGHSVREAANRRLAVARAATRVTVERHTGGGQVRRHMRAA